MGLEQPVAMQWNSLRWMEILNKIKAENFQCQGFNLLIFYEGVKSQEPASSDAENVR